MASVPPFLAFDAATKLPPEPVMGALGGRLLAPDVIAPKATGDASTDTVNAQAAVDATPVGGWLHFRAGRYVLNQTVQITRNIKITGAAISENIKNGTLPDIPYSQPPLTGTVFEQTLPGADGFHIQMAAGPTVHLSDFGIQFATAIRFVNTGHGIKAEPVAGQDAGLALSTWERLNVFGHDGNHYAFQITNPMHNALTSLRSHGGGVMQLLSRGGYVNYGNTVVTHPYGVLLAGGTAHGYAVEASDTSTNGLGLMNFLVFVRPQVNAGNYSASSLGVVSIPQLQSGQMLWQDTDYSGRLRNNLVIAPDFETNDPNFVHKVLFLDGTQVIRAGGTLPAGTWSRSRFEYDGSGPLVTPAPLTGAGTGATVSPAEGANRTDRVGKLVFTTGTTAPTTGDQFSVTFGTARTVQPKAVLLQWADAMPTDQARVLQARNLSTTGFSVRIVPPLPASTGVQLYYRVID